MKTEEILTALRRLKVETGSLVCMGCGREHDCGVRGCRIMREAAELIEKLTDRCARYAEEIAVLQEREKWVPVTERLQEISNSWGGYRMLSCASLAILPDTHRRIRDCVYIWRTEDGRATGGLCGLRIGCRCRMGRRWNDEK